MNNLPEILIVFVLGLLQGLTEFLPVSSSGHLVLMQHFMGMKEPQLFLDIMVHVGTLGAICLVYYRIIWKIMKGCVRMLGDRKFYRSPFQMFSKNAELQFVWFIILGNIPAGLVGVLLKDSIESAFASPVIVACMLIVTGLFLQLSRVAKKNPNPRQALNSWDAIRIGIAQAVAIMPGISRSGSTISVGLATGVSPQTAAQYSFLLSVPAILGASALELKDIHEVSLAPISIIIGTLTAFIVGYIALRGLLATLNRGRFVVFSYYCFGLGGLVLLIKILL
ncbi:undecaprenyl-diphosphate phosphatase [Candidatus Poribacteria bacterium]|nr:undecaprenyl-diphosphate phosphatase [Candidatus Poribacteria bacterium]